MRNRTERGPNLPVLGCMATNDWLSMKEVKTDCICKKIGTYRSTDCTLHLPRTDSRDSRGLTPSANKESSVFMRPERPAYSLAGGNTS